MSAFRDFPGLLEADKRAEKAVEVLRRKGARTMAERAFGVEDVAELETTFGAVALIDVLGFKEVRREFDDRQVMRALVAARDTMHAISSHLDSRGDHRLRVACFSDTIIATMEAPDAGKAVLTLARTLMVFLHRAITDPHRIPMVYRGCLTIGQFAAGGEFFVGPAIDDAAEWYERSDAAIVWLTPRAERVVAGDDHSLVRWPVELKALGPLDTFAVSLAPPGSKGADGEPIGAAELQRLYARPFARAVPTMPPGVAIKKQRTMAYLQAVHAHSVKWREDGTKVDGGDAHA